MMQIEASLFREIQDYAEINHVPIINLEGANLLVQIVSSSKPLSILEIGTAIGYSTLKFIEHMPSDANVVSIELDSERVEIAKAFIAKTGAENKVQIIAGDAGSILPQLTGPFDLVFIDAAKGQYLDYFKKVEDKLSPCSVVIADNVLFRGYVESNEAPPRRYKTIVKRLREYLNYVTDHPNFNTHLHRVGDGVAISYYRGKKSE